MAQDNKQKKKKSFRKEYLNDFQKDASGKYVYSGDHLEYEGEKREWQRDIMLMWVCCAVPAILLLVIGFMSGSGLVGNILIILPYALEMIALFITVWKLVRLTYAGVRMRKYVHASTAGHIPAYAGVSAACGALALAGIIISLIIRTYSGSLAGMIIYIAAQAALIAGGLLIMRTINGMRWHGADQI